MLEAYDFDFSKVMPNVYAYRIGSNRISEEQTPAEDEVADRASVIEALDQYAQVGTASIVTHHGTRRIVPS